MIVDESDHKQHQPVADTGANSAGSNTIDSSGQWGPLALAYLIIAGLAIVVIGIAFHAGAWVATQIKLSQDVPIEALLWPGIAALCAAVIAIVCLPALLMRRYRTLHRTGLSWLYACLGAGLFGLTRVVPIADGDVQLGLQAVVFGLVAAVLWLIRRRHPRNKPQSGSGTSWLWALCAGLATMLPWIWSGALGSWWDTVCAAAVALSFAVVAAHLLGDWFWSVFNGLSTAKRFFGGGSAAGIALLILSGGVAGPGIQVPIMVALPALAFAIAALQYSGQNCGRVVVAATTPALFGPLAFIDADEFLPLTLGTDFGAWAAMSALAAIIIAWLCAGLVLVLRHRPRIVVGITVVVLAGAAALSYVTAQPGFHGEKLFVVMAKQADVSQVSQQSDSRREKVHELLVNTAVSSQKPLRKALSQDSIAYRPFYAVNAIEVADAPLRRQWLEARSDVAQVLLAPQARPVRQAPEVMHGKKADTAAPQPNIAAINAPKAWKAGADGSKITIGISDSGVDGKHPAVADNFRGGDDSWLDPINGTKHPTDPNGHGTHALGLAAGDNGVGVAPGSQWIGCANLPRNSGNPADYLACLQYMLAPYPQDGDAFSDGDPSRAPDIVTNSWGCPSLEGCNSTVLGGAIRALSASGTFVVVAAGNAGPSCGSASTPPANYADSLSVGAVNSHNVLASFSSRGPVKSDHGKLAKPDVSAPGVDVISALPGDGYGKLSGTSMAAPQVAGAVALLWSAAPGLKGDIPATMKALTSTAKPVKKAQQSAIDACGRGNSAGAGVIDVAAALKKAS